MVLINEEKIQINIITYRICPKEKMKISNFMFGNHCIFCIFTILSHIFYQ